MITSGKNMVESGELNLTWLIKLISTDNTSVNDISRETFSALRFEGADVVVNGYILPSLCFVVLVTNALFLTVFAVRKLNSPTHIVLRYIALSDTLTILLPTPCFIYMFTLGHHAESMPYTLCRIWDSLVTYVPTMTHTASTWLTCLLAVQRCVCVSFPLNVRLWCGVARTYIFITIIFLLSIACHICRFFETVNIKIVVESKMDKFEMVESCQRRINSDFVTTDYHVIYYWTRSIFANVLPCFTMVIFNGIMIYKIRKAENRRTFLRRRSTFGSGENEPRDSRLTTWLVIFIVNCVVLVEMPIAIYMILYTVALNTGEEIIPAHLLKPFEMVLNLCVRGSYPMLFVMYCCMSESFRKTLRKIVFAPFKLCRGRECRHGVIDSPSVSNNRRSTSVITVSDSGNYSFTTV